MKDFSQLSSQLQKGPGGEKLRQVMESAEGQAIAKTLDTAQLERAVKSGDSGAMKAILAQVLSSPDGRALAQKVQQAMKENTKGK